MKLNVDNLRDFCDNFFGIVNTFKARRSNNVNFYQSLVSKDLLLETITSSSFNVQSPEIAK